MVRWAILAGFMVAPVAMIAWIALRGRNPALEPARAASIISSMPEFNHTRSLLTVSYTYDIDDSMGERYYADFTFKEHASATPVQARGEFKYWSGNWHLLSFQYGQHPNVKRVAIRSDPLPADLEFSK